jgi:outer membrane lipoprotein-sorting protein
MAPLVFNVRPRMPLYANAREFLSAVEARYRSLPAYSDTGVARSFSLRRPRTCTFETAYVAPGHFRFAFETPHPYRPLAHHVSRDVIGTDGNTVYFYSRSYGGQAELEYPESLLMAVAGATGISSGTAHTIGALLFEEIGGFRLTDMRRIRFRSMREFMGVKCVVVSGLHPGGRGRVTAWFGAEDLLLRRLVRYRMKAEELRFNPKPLFSGGQDAFQAPRSEV